MKFTDHGTTSYVDTPSFAKDAATAFELFRVRGFHIEHGLISEARCDALVAIAMTMPAALDGSFSPIPMPHRAHPEFLAMLKHPPIVGIVEKLVGGRASAIGGEFFFMPPGTPGFTNHQDNYYVQARPAEAFVSVWIALCDVDMDNGCLVFIPGSHNLGELPTSDGDGLVAPGQNPGARRTECVLPKEMPAENVCVKKGDVVFFHSLLVHRSSDNRSRHHSRYSQLITYIKVGTPFRSGGRQMREEIELYD